jgi:hypothetical protein
VILEYHEIEHYIIDATDIATEIDQSKQRKAHWFIRMIVSTDLIGVIQKCKTAADAWKAIQEHFIVMGASTQRYVRKQLAETRYQEGHTRSGLLNDHIAFLKSVVEKLSCIYITITADEYVNSHVYISPHPGTAL